MIGIVWPRGPLRIVLAALMVVAAPSHAAENAVTAESLQDQPLLQVEAPLAQPVTVVQSAVTTQTLSDITLDSLGITDPKRSLPIEMWRNTNYDQALRLIASLPNQVQAPSARELQVNMLLSAARPPERSGKFVPGDALLLWQRVDKLWQMGQWTAFGELVQSLPKNILPQGVRQNYLLAQIIGGQADPACAEVTKLAKEFANDLFWHQGEIYCALKSGDNDRARLQHELWREKKPGAENDWDRLLTAALGGKPAAAMTANESWQAWHWLLILQTKLQPKVADVKILKDTIVQVVALNTDALSVAQKIEVAEKLALQGSISGRKLGEIYALLPPAPPKDAAQTASIRRAIAWQQEQAITDVAARALALSDHWHSAKGEAERRVIALSRLPWLSTLNPQQPELAFLSPVAVRALILSGQSNLAQNWLQTTGQDSIEAGKNWPYLRLSRSWPTAPRPLQSAAKTWAESVLAQNPRELEQQLAWVELLARALGDNDAVFDRATISATPSADSLGVIAKQSLSPALQSGLMSALRRQTLGEGALLSLLAVRGPALGGVSADGMVRVLETLSRFGLGAVAKNLALETMVVNDI
jgi:hypothetical protein